MEKVTTLLNGVYQAVAELKAIEPTYKAAQEQIHTEILQLSQIIGNDDTAQDAMIAYLYWFESYVTVASIEEAFHLEDGEARELACQVYPDIRCIQCGDPLINPENKRPRRSRLCGSCANITRTATSSEEVAARLKKAETTKRIKTEKNEREKQLRVESEQRKKQKQELTEDRILELRAMLYRDYLQTSEWFKKRYATLKRAGSRCQVCNTSEGTLDVHHRTYANLGDERYTDLIVLCRKCHGVFHRNGKLAKEK